jgi:hypothetical protein
MSGNSFLKINKGLTLKPQSAEPTNPTDGAIYYDEQLGRGRIYTNGAWRDLGSGGGSGGKNYFESDSADFETLSIGNWQSSNAGLALSATTVTAEILAGSASLKLVKDAANRNNQYISLESLPIDQTDRGKVLFGSFAYKTISGYVNGDLVLEVFDVTNSVVLYSGPAENLSILNGSGRFDFTAATELTTEQVELRLKVANTNTNTFTIVFDEFRLGPAASVNVETRTNWQSVPNPASLIKATVTNPTTATPVMKWRRIGSDLLLEFSYNHSSAQTAGSGVYEIELPFGLSSNRLSTGLPFIHVGNGAISAGVSNAIDVTVQLNNANRLRFLLGNSTTGQTYWESANATYNFGVTALRLNFQVRVPDIVGWDVNQVLTTNELGLQAGAFRASRNGSNQTVGPNNSGIKILFNSVSAPTDYQKGLTYDAANSRFVHKGPPATYNFAGSLSISSGTNVLANGYFAEIRVNNSSTARILGTEVKATAGVGFTLNVSGVVNLINDDVVEMFLYGRGNNSSSQITVSGAAIETYFSGYRLPDFTVLGAVRSPGTYVEGQTEYFTSSGTWTKPAGLKAVEVEVVGGGGSGGGAQATGASAVAEAGAGGGGGFARKFILASALGNTETVTVGAAGAAASAGADGNGGGTSSFGAHCSATGGAGGTAGTASSGNVIAAGGSGGSGSGGNLNFSGSRGIIGKVVGGVLQLNNVSSTSFYSQTTYTTASNTNGTTPEGFGGGSSGARNASSQSARASTAGAPGIVIIKEYF